MTATAPAVAVGSAVPGVRQGGGDLRPAIGVAYRPKFERKHGLFYAEMLRAEALRGQTL